MGWSSLLPESAEAGAGTASKRQESTSQRMDGVTRGRAAKDSSSGKIPELWQHGACRIFMNIPIRASLREEGDRAQFVPGAGTGVPISNITVSAGEP